MTDTHFDKAAAKWGTATALNISSIGGILDVAETGFARILLYNTNTPVNHLRPVRQSQQLLVDGCIALRSNAVKFLNTLVSELNRLTGFDSFHNQEFAEKYLTHLVGGETTSHSENFDCLLKSGVKIEIKFSKPITNRRAGKEPYIYFTWTRLNGVNGAKKGKVDYLVLAGYHKKYFIWVVPYRELKRNSFEYQITGRKFGGGLDMYFVGDETNLIEYFKGLS